MSQQGRNMVVAAPAGANLAARRWQSSRCQFVRRRHPSPRGLHGCSSRQRGHLSQMRNFILRHFPMLQTDFYLIGCIVDFCPSTVAAWLDCSIIARACVGAAAIATHGGTASVMHQYFPCVLWVQCELIYVGDQGIHLNC